VHRHLKSVGKSITEFLAFLELHNVTLIFELADDEFEGSKYSSYNPQSIFLSIPLVRVDYIFMELMKTRSIYYPGLPKRCVMSPRSLGLRVLPLNLFRVSMRSVISRMSVAFLDRLRIERSKAGSYEAG
jgi:hypothetical protein